MECSMTLFFKFYSKVINCEATRIFSFLIIISTVTLAVKRNCAKRRKSQKILKLSFET